MHSPVSWSTNFPLASCASLYMEHISSNISLILNTYFSYKIKIYIRNIKIITNKLWLSKINLTYIQSEGDTIYQRIGGNLLKIRETAKKVNFTASCEHFCPQKSKNDFYPIVNFSFIVQKRFMEFTSWPPFDRHLNTRKKVFLPNFQLLITYKVQKINYFLGFQERKDNKK